jgi:hypothetical protein
MIAFLVGALATWRISSLLVHEDGPAEVLAKFRDHVGVRADKFGGCIGDGVLASALCCLWCTSVWVGWIVALTQSRNIPRAAKIGLAYSAAAIVIQKALEDKS